MFSRGTSVATTPRPEGEKMANKRAKQKKPKQNQNKMSGQKGGSMSFQDIGSPKPVKKNKKKS
jgi:hypothetical protein